MAKKTKKKKGNIIPKRKEELKKYNEEIQELEEVLYGKKTSITSTKDLTERLITARLGAEIAEARWKIKELKEAIDKETEIKELWDTITTENLEGKDEERNKHMKRLKELNPEIAEKLKELLKIS